MRYRVSADAERALDEIYVYWAVRENLEIADRVVDRITERFWLLGQHPNTGKAAFQLAAGVRCFPAGKYLIYHRKSPRGTDILHIFHGARDQRKAFRKAGKRS